MAGYTVAFILIVENLQAVTFCRGKNKKAQRYL